MLFTKVLVVSLRIYPFPFNLLKPEDWSSVEETSESMCYHESTDFYEWIAEVNGKQAKLVALLLKSVLVFKIL